MKRALLITGLVTLALGVILAGVGRPERWPEVEAPPRQGEAVATNDPAHHSPTALARLVREPQNTWSNLVFVAGGAWLVAVGRRPIARSLGSPLIAVGIGSFLYHASASRTLRHFDVGAMYWVLLVAATFAGSTLVSALRPKLNAHAGAVLLITGGAAIILTMRRNVRMLGFKPFSLDIAIGAAAAIILLALAVAARRDATLTGVGRVAGIIGLFALALVCQLGDRAGGWLFSPTSPIQAHALWHVLAAMAFVAAVRMLDCVPPVEGDAPATAPA